MTSVELYVAKANNDRLQLWIDSTEALKRAVIKSLGKVVRQNIQEVRYLFQRMSVTDILAKVTARYGQMQKDTNRADLKERILTTLPTSDGLDTHISNLKEMFEISNTAGFPIDEKDHVDTFRETICGHPLLVKILETFDFDFPDARHLTFLQLTDYLTLHLPHLRHAQITATRAHANLVAATAYAALESESEKLRKEFDQFKRKRTTQPPKKQNKQKKYSTQGLSNVGTDAASEQKYCFLHGFQKSHTSSECKVLAGDKTKFTNEMRRAKGPNNPPRESTNINGQKASAAPRRISANVAFDSDQEAASEHGEYDNNDSSGDEETAAFLASVLDDKNDSDESSGYFPPDYSTTQVTAMMVHDDIILLDDACPRATLIAAPIDDYIDQLIEREDEAEVNELNEQEDTADSKFSIRLLFPDKQTQTLIFPVRKRMPVSLLHLQISELTELLVGPSWNFDILEHRGTISDRVFPNTNVPCPFLQEGTRVLVYFTRPDPTHPPSPIPLGSSSLDVAPAVGGWCPIESVRETNKSPISTRKTPYEPPSNLGTMEGSSRAEEEITTTPHGTMEESHVALNPGKGKHFEHDLSKMRKQTTTPNREYLLAYRRRFTIFQRFLGDRAIEIIETDAETRGTTP
jgi:hypothetical protein